MENTNVKTEVADLIKKLYQFLGKEKSADILIIKAHLLCEYYINQLLIFRGSCEVKELEDSLSFFEKINKVFTNISNKEDRFIFNSLKRLNKLRNKVGYELHYKLSESDIDFLGFEEGQKYILRKYSLEKDNERLRSVLENIVVETAVLLFTEIRIERKNVAR